VLAETEICRRVSRRRDMQTC